MIVVLRMAAVSAITCCVTNHPRPSPHPLILHMSCVGNLGWAWRVFLAAGLTYKSAVSGLTHTSVVEGYAWGVTGITGTVGSSRLGFFTGQQHGSKSSKREGTRVRVPFRFLHRICLCSLGRIKSQSQAQSGLKKNSIFAWEERQSSKLFFAIYHRHYLKCFTYVMY